MSESRFTTTYYRRFYFLYTYKIPKAFIGAVDLGPRGEAAVLVELHLEDRGVDDGERAVKSPEGFPPEDTAVKDDHVVSHLDGHGTVTGRLHVPRTVLVDDVHLQHTV